MEPNEVQAAMATAVEDVLETMCFLGVCASGQGIAPPDAGGSTPPDGAADARTLTAELRFEGNSAGAFRLSLPLSLAQTAGAGFLGLDEAAASDAQAAEVVCELANMICGSVLGRLEHSTIFRLSHPELIPTLPGPGHDALSNTRWFDTGEGVLSVSLSMQHEYAL